MKARTMTLLVTILIAAFATVAMAVEAVRTGRWELDSGGAADEIPAGFYGNSFLPDGVLDNAGWVAGAGIVWIVAAALLVALDIARSRSKTALPRPTDMGER